MSAENPKFIPAEELALLNGKILEIKDIPEEFQIELQLPNNNVQIVDSRIPAYRAGEDGLWYVANSVK